MKDAMPTAIELIFLRMTYKALPQDIFGQSLALWLKLVLYCQVFNNY